LRFLDLGNNDLNGTLPVFTHLTALVVTNNDLQGTLPTNLTTVQNLNVSGNRFSGPMPAGYSTQLEVLDVSGNSLNGTIPDLGRYTNLTVLNLANNLLTGGLPTSLGSCTGLTTLNVSRNSRLGGSIPATFVSLSRLRRLLLADSNLTGTIPQELQLLTLLTEIDLSDNRLWGAIPFRNLRNLTLLHLQNNRLEGDFLAQVPSFPVLGSLDLTNNQLTGSIPGAIGDVQLTSGLLLGRNLFNGSIPNGLGQLTLVQRIDLSDNRFSGAIPDGIRTCLSLRELNISHNMFNGSLPMLSSLPALKLFDGSYNNFTGRVSSTFVNFPALQTLNVSSNQLSGEVPVFVKHDNVTERSFLNNPGLCSSVLGLGSCSDGKLATSTIVYISIGSAAGVVALLVIFFLVCVKRKGWSRKGSKHSSQVSAELQLKVTPDEILAATDQFNHAGYIGGGKLSTVYKGVLPDGTPVAVKRLAITSPATGKEEAEKVLDEQLEVLGHIRHKSLVNVLGYCSSPQSKALVMEYMPHGSLESILVQSEEVNRAFDWIVRFKVALEVAEGLKHLHSESRRPLVHGDLKPSNILFDANMEARIADHGVGRILTEQGYSPASSPSSSGNSANGYIAPEVAEFGIASMKGDVYSFGIILLRLITGRSPRTLEPGQTMPQWVRATVSSGKGLQNVLDPHLMPDLAMHQQRMAMVLGVALLCTRHQPNERPNMEDVHKMLAHIRNKPAGASSRRKGHLSSTRRSHSTMSRSRSSALIELQPVSQPLQNTPSLSDWTPPSNV
jgi:LRR receptor-like serine/threonine-protein kinase FLS2